MTREDALSKINLNEYKYDQSNIDYAIKKLKISGENFAKLNDTC